MHRRASIPALALLAALLLALPAAAYTIYLKDGSQIVARDRYEVRDGKAYFTLQSGTATVLDVDEIDVQRTERANRNNLGTAVVLEGETPDAAAQPAPQEDEGPRLGDLVRQRQARREAAPRPQPETEGDADAGAAPELPRTPAGYPDLMALPRQPYPRLEMGAEIKRIFRAQGIDAVQIYLGTAPGRPLVEVVTSAEASAFRALAVAASSLIRLAERERPPQTLELLLVTPEGGRAGQFALTPEMARSLLSGELDISTFYLRNVQF